MKSVAFTIVMVAWLENHHIKLEYKLLLKKSKGWISKFMKEAQIKPKFMNNVQILVKSSDRNTFA